VAFTLEPPATPHESLALHAERSPDREAVICGQRALTYGELARSVAGVAEALTAARVAAGGRVGVETQDPVDHVIGLLGAMTIGAIPVALPADAPSTYTEIVDDSAPQIVLTSALPAETARGDLPTLSLADVAPGDHVGLLARRPEPEDIAMLYYTSGTTSGIRKGVMQSYRALHTTVRYISAAMELDETVREFVASPTDNAFWFGRVRVVLHNGGCAVLNEGSLNPLRLLGAVNRHGCNSLAGDTPVFVMLLHHMERRLAEVGPQLRWAKVASQAMSVDDKQRLSELLPNARVVMNYGLTEAMRCCILPFKDFPDKLETVGRPCDTVELRVVDADGNLLPPDEVGDIEVRGGNLASGYWGKPDLWHERTASGWFATNDLGSIDADGFVTVKGRKDDAVNVGGRTIAPAEVEIALQPHLTAESFAVCGMRDPDGVLGDILCLCVENDWREQTSWKEFRIRLFERVPPSLVPKEAFVVPALPRTRAGKVQRGKLRADLEAANYRQL
jgi:long-chain acyl-CoA synthetase